jgi:Cdc6-like AAA superfamily ATPase
VDAYDAVSGSAIEARFGSDVFKKSWEEADRQFREKHNADIQNVSHSE